MRIRVACAVMMAAAMVPSVARGNGRFPTSQMVQVSAGPQPARIVLRTTFGVLLGSAASPNWSWMCESALGYGSQVWDPPVALGSPGADGVPLLVGVPTGLGRTTGTCGTTPVPEVGTDFTADISATPDGATVYWAGSFRDADAGSLSNRVRVSTDGGRTFRTTFEGLSDVLVLTLEAAPSNPRRVYLSAHGDNPVRDAIHRSDDGGATFTAFPLDLAGASQAWISGVDPTNPDVVYVRSFATDPTLGSIEPGATRLLRSTDGGAHFAEVGRTAGVMRGFALSDDGRTLWIGGPDDGLLESVAGGAFAPVARTSVQCLRYAAGTLYVCGTHAADGFDLARSTDGGRTLVPMVDFPSLSGPSSCPAGTPVHDVCAPTWPSVAATFGPRTDAGTMRDAAGDAGEPATTARGCGCGVAGGRGMVVVWGWVWGVMALVLRGCGRRSAVGGRRMNSRLRMRNLPAQVSTPPRCTP